MSEYLSMKEVVDLLKINSRTLYSWRAQGDFPEPIKINGGVLRWRREDVVFWVRLKVLRSLTNE